MKQLPTFENTCIVVITYNPKITDFIRNINRHLLIASKIIIVDNASTCKIEDSLVFFDENRILLLKSDENKGIAWGLNQGITRAISNGFIYILTFDQDSLPCASILDKYAFILQKESSVGLIGSRFTGRQERNNQPISWKNHLTLITSGTLHSKEVIDKVGFYDENLFIDSVDFDYNLRTRMAGYSLIIVNNKLLYHELGNPIKKWGIVSSNYNSSRVYYSWRNNIVMTKKYFMNFPLWIIYKNIFMVYDFLKLILIEKDRFKKIKSIIRGVRDGIKYKSR